MNRWAALWSLNKLFFFFFSLFKSDTFTIWLSAIIWVNTTNHNVTSRQQLLWANKLQQSYCSLPDQQWLAEIKHWQPKDLTSKQPAISYSKWWKTKRLQLEWRWDLGWSGGRTAEALCRLDGKDTVCWYVSFNNLRVHMNQWPNID